MNIPNELKISAKKLGEILQNTPGVQGVGYGLPSFSNDEEDLGILIYVNTSRDQDRMIERFGDDYGGWPLYAQAIGTVHPAGA